MDITRREHATMVVEHDGARLVIDPGKFSTFPDVPTDVAGIMITHEHADHWSPDFVRAIAEANPEAKCFATTNVATHDPDIEFTVTLPGEHAQAGPFDLRFYGGRHAEIHASIPLIANVGVLVNHSFFYGGDALEPPGVPVDMLAVPLSGPWLKMGEMMDYVLAVQPNHTFGVHDLLNSPFGNNMASTRLTWATEQIGGTHVEAGVGDTVHV